MKPKIGFHGIYKYSSTWQCPQQRQGWLRGWICFHHCIAIHYMFRSDFCGPNIIHIDRGLRMGYRRIARWVICWGLHVWMNLVIILIVRRAGLLWSQQDFEWWWSVLLCRELVCITVKWTWYNGRDNFFHITSGRINTWKGVNQLKELFFLNLIIFLNTYLKLTYHSYFKIRNPLFFHNSQQKWGFVVKF